MSRSVANRNEVFPHTTEERDAILIELRAIIASSHFCNSKRYPALLRYVVENTLTGRSDLLKERTLGVEVFDRSPNYDTNADTVVRYTATEVRKRLLLYYSENQSSGGIRISLPAGSYIPEFLQDHGKLEDIGEQLSSSEPTGSTHKFIDAPILFTTEPGVEASLAEVAQTSQQKPAHESRAVKEETDAKTLRRFFWPVMVMLLLVVLAAGFSLRRSTTASSERALDEFWAPIVHDPHPVLICTGGVVFKESMRSGVITADKNSEYPFVSMQIASALVPISGLIERSGATAQLLPAPTTPLSELREHPVVLVGGYNNQWAMRLLESQPFQFTPGPNESIIDRAHPEVHWSRDPAIPYSSADDYAIVARFRDTSTGSWVVVLAGLGRNGTEAAAQFATSPEHMRALEEQLPGGIGNRDIVAVLRLRVIDGKTGSPSILAARSH
jgi:hypothetical protein